MISARTEMLAADIWMHFFASFTLSGLIALAYSLCGSQFVIQRALYPRMWDDVRHFTAVARQELAPMSTRLGWIQLLAGSCPCSRPCWCSCSAAHEILNRSPLDRDRPDHPRLGRLPTHHARHPQPDRNRDRADGGEELKPF